MAIILVMKSLNKRKTFLTFATSVLVSSAVNGQIKENEKLSPDTLGLKKTEGTIVESPSKKPIIFGYQHRTKNQNSDPFVLNPYRDSLSIKAVNIPNAYRRDADKSVAIPTFSLGPSLKSNTRPIAFVEQLIKP